MWQRAVGGLSLASSVGTGAFGSHGLMKLPHTTEDDKKKWDAALRYHQLGSLTLLIIPALVPPAQKIALQLSSALVGGGTALFSGSVYAKTYTGNEALGKAAPVGGISMILGFVTFAVLRR